MKKSKSKSIFFLLTGVFLIFGCKKDDISTYKSDSPTPVTINYPSNFPDMVIPEDNQPTKEGIALGRALYYDKILSKNQDKSCSSCHDQTKGFTTFQSNSLAHINLAWNDYYLWNGRDRKSTRLNSSHVRISYAVFCLKKKKKI